MFNKKLIECALAVTAVAALAAPVAQAADVTAAVGAANMYYWRGVDLGKGDGDPQIWGELDVGMGGMYAGAWAASGDAKMGTEYDLYAGYKGTIQDFTYNFSLWTYSYPSSPTPLEPGDLSEAVVTLGYGPVSYTYMDNIAGATSYTYQTLGVTFGAFSLTYGMHSMDNLDSDSHLDLAYAFNDKLKFIVGTGFDKAAGAGGIVDDTKLVVQFSLPITF